MSTALHVWDLWIPDAASQGVSFARGTLRAADAVLVHAAPTRLRVEVRDAEGRLVARADGLERAADVPMTELTVEGGAVRRAERWPDDRDLGRPVILPGGEVGLLRSWWNDEAGRRWRWTVEFSNQR